MKIFSVDVNMFGTVYVRAETPEEATVIVDKEWRQTSVELAEDEVAYDGRSFLSASISIESRDARRLEEFCDEADFTWPERDDT